MIVKLIASGSQRWELWTRRWGLSYLVDEDVLFDTFANPRVLLRNLRRYGAYVERLRHVVISHDHWDHTGGLWPLIERVQGLKVHVPACANEAFKERIVRAGGCLVEGREGHVIKEGVHVSRMMIGKFSGKTVAEQALVLESKGKLLILCGCGHPGVASMVENIMRDFDRPVHGVMGGFHFFDGVAAPESVRAHALRLKTMGIEMVAPTHCTGNRACGIFKESFANACLFLREGQCVAFGRDDS